MKWAVQMAIASGALRIDRPQVVRRFFSIYQEIGNDHSLAVVPVSIKQDNATRRHDGSPANVWRNGPRIQGVSSLQAPMLRYLTKYSAKVRPFLQGPFLGPNYSSIHLPKCCILKKIEQVNYKVLLVGYAFLQ